MSSRPIVIFVHGAYHGASAFDLTRHELEGAGYKVVSSDQATCSEHPPVEAYDEDVATISTAITSELEIGNDVVIVAHSYGGIPASQALRDVEAQEVKGNGGREARSEKVRGGVRKVILMSAFALNEGHSLYGYTGGNLAKGVYLKASLHTHLAISE